MVGVLELLWMSQIESALVSPLNGKWINLGRFGYCQLQVITNVRARYFTYWRNRDTNGNVSDILNAYRGVIVNSIAEI